MVPMHLFYQPDLSTDTFELPDEEARHAISVLRLRVGEHVGLLNGKGLRAEAGIVSIGKRSCTVSILSRDQAPVERKAPVHLAVAPTKQMERFEWLLEKCTEIGVDRITPLITERTERERLRPERAERVLVSAMKQSKRAWLPALDTPTTLAELMRTSAYPQRFFGWCEGEHQPLSRAYSPRDGALVVIGPEGDLTPAEAASLTAAGFTSVSLGEARLRTETAAITACTWMNFAQQ